MSTLDAPVPTPPPAPLAPTAPAGPEPRAWSVSIAPHVRAGVTTERIMWTVAACLVPSLVLSAVIFGPRVLVVTAVSIASCVLCEWASQRMLGRPVTVLDGSAVITGLLIAFVIPPGVPWWMPILGGVMAIFVTKQLMGGLGFNIFNPALIARAFLMATFPVAMTSAWLVPLGPRGVDAVATATPLYVLKHHGVGALVEKFGLHASMYGNFFVGLRPGCIGETSVLLLLLGGIVLLWKRYITWHTPAAMFASVAALTWIFGGDGWFRGDPLLAVLTGGVPLGAIFMATDYATSPSTRRGQLVFGAGAGALTVLIRLKGGYPEGVAYAILLMNGLTPALDGWFKPRRFAPPLGART
jgi:Na+-translocating ferredoxin:NAD+ oxidoreductase subunit D